MSNPPPPRSEVPTEHQWNLQALFPDDATWEERLASFEKRYPRIEAFQGELGKSAEQLREALDLMMDLAQTTERLSYYAFLRVSEDMGNSEAQGRLARFQAVATRYAALSSFVTPEIQAIPDQTMHEWLQAEYLEPYRIYLRKLLRYKPHVLSAAEERLLAMQSEFSQTARQGFNALTDVDMTFGTVSTPEGERTLTHGTYAGLMQHEDRSVRAKTYTQYLESFHNHRHTLAALYNGSVQLDVYSARVRNFASSREAHLFDDDVPVSVYDQLIASVHEALPALHRYYDLRRRALGLDELRLYDTRVPLVRDVKTRYTYEQAVDLVTDSLHVLGDDYVSTLREGLLGRWVDRYENKGKRSGAFSAASYHGDPYILMNYNEDVLNDVFTLTHEAGHSMHSWYSVRNNPFQDYGYTIFVAEVASTFNEQCLADHMIAQSDDDSLKAYLINKQIDDILATLFRQTMFAEFEHRTHEMVELNQPLTIDSLTAVYEELLKKYFGEAIPLEAHSALEGLRVPHFYSAFYVYKYATGLAAAIALYQVVKAGDPAALDRYLNFLKSGGSKFPLEQLRDAGVDMSTPHPVQAALKRFSDLVDQLESVIPST